MTRQDDVSALVGELRAKADALEDHMFERSTLPPEIDVMRRAADALERLSKPVTGEEELRAIIAQEWERYYKVPQSGGGLEGFREGKNVIIPYGVIIAAMRRLSKPVVDDALSRSPSVRVDDEMVKDIRTAATLSAVALEAHRYERNKTGLHSDITYTDKSGQKCAGLWQAEYDQLQRIISIADKFTAALTKATP